MSNESVINNIAPEDIMPMADRVLLEREEAEEKTAGGIIMPDTARDSSALAVVISFGKGEMKDGHLVPVDVVKGQRVMIPKYAGHSFKLGANGKSYVIVKCNEILLKLK